jgi:quinoprotein glucose dehydrogenase
MLQILRSRPVISGAVFALRGVAYYEVDDPECPRRVYAPIFDARIVALNADDGRPCTGFGTPTIYIAPDGHQYVVVTAGGHGALETRYGDYTIAFRLP